jgi:glycosyltransferase involved in cell wall biosynthesis
MSIDFSVVMAVKNEMAYLKKAVESVLAQSFPSFEFIVVDDSSTDGTWEYLASLTDERVHVFRNRGVGQTAGLNFGIEMAKSQWIARMDGDDWSAPERFARQWALISSRPDVALVTSDYVICDEDLTEIATIRLANNEQRVLNYLKNRNNPFCHPTIFFKKSAAVEGYDERLKNAQDMGLYKKILMNGRWAHIPEALLKYRVRKQSLSIARHPEQEIERRMNLSGQTYNVEVAPARSGTRVTSGLYAYKLGFAAWLAGQRITGVRYLSSSLIRGVRPLRSLALIVLSLFPRPLYLMVCGYRGVYR